MVDMNIVNEYIDDLQLLADEDNITFFPPQIEGARRILQAFTTGNTALLLAHMQSGKSGTFILASIIMIHIGAVKQSILFSGISLNELYLQLINDVSIKCNIYEQTMGLKKGYISNKIKVLSNKDKSKILLDDNIMVVWDESHYAQDNSNRPNKMFERSGYGIDDASLHTWSTKNSFLLDVSATPFSEFINIIHTNSTKQIIRLDVTDNYRGIEKLLNNSSFRESYDIQENIDKFVDDILLNIDFDKPTYMLFRVSNQNEVIDIIQNTYTDDEIDIEYMDQQHLNIQWIHLNTRPLKPTFIFLKNKGRIGQVVPKQYVSLTFEYSKSGGNTDTISQSLPGRMCGYISNDTINPIIYIPSKFLKTNHIPEKLQNIYDTKKKIIDIIQHDPIKKQYEISHLDDEFRFMTRYMSMNELQKYVEFMKNGKILPLYGKNIKHITNFDYKHMTSVYTINTKSYNHDEKLEELAGLIGTKDIYQYQYMSSALQEILDDIMLNEHAFGNTIQRAEIIFRLRDIISSRDFNRIHFQDIGEFKHSHNIDTISSAIKFNMPFHTKHDKEISIFVCNARISFDNIDDSDYQSSIDLIGDYTQHFNIYISGQTICNDTPINNIITTGNETFSSKPKSRSTVLCIRSDAVDSEINMLMSNIYNAGTILNVTIPNEQYYLINKFERARYVYYGPYVVTKRRGRVSRAEMEMCKSTSVCRYTIEFFNDSSIF